MSLLVTDMCCDLSKEFCERNHVLVMPMVYNLNGTDYVHSFAKESPVAFYTAVRNGAMPKTSQINTNEFIDFFTPLLEQGNDIIYLAFSSGLSGTYNSSRIAVEELRAKFPERKIDTVDTLAASMGEGLYVYYAVCKRDSGASHEELVEYLESIKQHINHWFTVDDLHHLRRGGRVSATTAIVGSMLSIKPVLHCDENGKLTAVSKAKGRKRSLIGLVEKLREQGIDVNGQKIFISHGDCLEDALFVRDLILKDYPQCTFEINFIGPVIGAHSGPGTVALFFYGSKR